MVPFTDRGIPAGAELGMFGSLQREIDRLFSDVTRGLGPSTNGLIPRIDVSEDDKQIEITAELPGLERKDVEILLDDNRLIIRGEKKVEAEQKDEKKNFHVMERGYGVFYRVIELPNKIDASAINATMQNGVLRLVVPKQAQTEAKKIEVKDAAGNGQGGSQSSGAQTGGGAQERAS
jgi:HSP20 family protein